MDIKNVVYYQTLVLTNPTAGTILYEAGVSGEAEGKGLSSIVIQASGPISVTYTTIFNVLVTAQVLTLTIPLVLGKMAVSKIELAVTLTGTLEISGEELMT